MPKYESHLPPSTRPAPTGRSNGTKRTERTTPILVTYYIPTFDSMELYHQELLYGDRTRKKGSPLLTPRLIDLSSEGSVEAVHALVKGLTGQEPMGQYGESIKGSFMRVWCELTRQDQSELDVPRYEVFIRPDNSQDGNPTVHMFPCDLTTFGSKCQSILEGSHTVVDDLKDQVLGSGLSGNFHDSCGPWLALSFTMRRLDEASLEEIARRASRE